MRQSKVRGSSLVIPRVCKCSLKPISFFFFVPASSVAWTMLHPFFDGGGGTDIFLEKAPTVIRFADASACVRMAVHAITTILENEEDIPERYADKKGFLFYKTKFYTQGVNK